MRWKRHPDLVGIAFSDSGEVVSLARRVRNAHGYFLKPRRVLKTNLTKDGYPRVTVQGRTLVIHRVVCELFVGPRPDGAEVDHKNGIKTDNRASNLRWVTHAQNMRNKGRYRNNKANKRGVRATASGRYEARIRVQGDLLCLGTFATKEQAYAARVAAEGKHFGRDRLRPD